jgi:UDP-N-acetylmuramate dehydrogenase
MDGCEMRHRTYNRLTDADRTWLRDLVGPAVSFDVSMARRTTLRIGGPADAWFEPRSIAALQAVVAGCASRGIPLHPVGGGSNLLVRDGGIPGVVVATRRLRAVKRVSFTALRVEAGTATSKLLSLATRWELGGLEFLGGVPGSVGGGLIMNAGTYLGEFKDVTESVRSVRLSDGAVATRDRDECGFVYRGSALPADEIVVDAAVVLQPRPRHEIERAVRALRDRRNQREPKAVANAGSIFKNPANDFAGRLIEAAGLKGLRVGGAQCSPVHANWLVNCGDATAADMLALIDQVRARVRDTHGVELELEIKVIGED